MDLLYLHAYVANFHIAIFKGWMIATTLCSRIDAAKTISRRHHDQSAACRDPHCFRIFQWVVRLNLGLVFFGWLALQVRVLSSDSETSSVEIERHHRQHLKILSSSNLSSERETELVADKLPNAARWNRVLYTGSFGFGHRMSKLSAAVHLIVSSEFRQYIPLVEVQWGTCPSSDGTRTAEAVDIFAYLFNSTELFLPNIESVASSEEGRLNPLHASGGKVLWIRNDVAGYYAGQAYKNARVALNYSRAFEVFQDKLRMDYSLYEHLFLSKRFIGFDEVQHYQKQHQWEKFFVMGVHIRAGNGEQNHFTSARRNGFAQQPEEIYSIAQSIQQLYRASMEEQRQADQMKAPLVFLATDTEYYIHALRKELSHFCDVIIFHQQPRVAPGQGVSYEGNWTNSDPQTCLKGWYGAAMDMMLLSSSDVIVATSRSTFTQIVPASILFHRTADHIWRYCEMDLFASSKISQMTCFRDQTSWLFRHNASAWHTFCTLKNSTSNNRRHLLCDENDSVLPVAHKLMIHFPDISRSGSDDRMYQSTIEFLQSSEPLFPNETLYYYGKKYNPKYRQSLKYKNMFENWTWQ